MRVTGFLMAAVFGAFAALQYNDPDAALWAAVYGFVSLASVAAALGRAGTVLPLLALAAVLPWAAVLAPSIDAGWYHDEAAREALGLLVAAAWLTALVITGRRAGRGPA